MKKVSLEKKLLYISFIPYIVYLLICLKNAIFGFCYNYIDVCYYGIEGFLESFSTIFFDTIFSFWAILLIIIVSYQLWYFIFRFKTKSEKHKSKKEVKNVSILKKIIFILSIICWVLYLGSGLHSFFFGTCIGFLNCEMVYGFDAMLDTLFWYGILFSMIPVLPITLIYIIMYIIRNKTKK